MQDNYRFILLVRASYFRSVSKTVSILEHLGCWCDWRTCRSRRGIFDVMKKFRRKILGCARLLIRCHSIPLQSDHDHDLVALLGTLGFECECLLFPVDDELYDPSYNINRGSGGTQEWPPRNELYLTTDIHLEYQMDICLGRGATTLVWSYGESLALAGSHSHMVIQAPLRS
jgi:hypothetical protein